MGGLLAGPASERKIPPSSSLPAGKNKNEEHRTRREGEYRERYFVLSEQLHLHFAFSGVRGAWSHRQHDGVSPLRSRRRRRRGHSSSGTTTSSTRENSVVPL